MLFNEECGRRNPIAALSLDQLSSLCKATVDNLTMSEKAILRRRQARDKGEAQPKLGVGHLKHMISLAPMDAGLSYQHILTEDSRNLPHTEPLQAAVRALSTCPAMVQAFDIVRTKTAAGKRVLLMVEQPHCLFWYSSSPFGR
ncbi:hypothetical protein MAPG_01927 [Magnaporthiopsis poae ATCC 64411]|uniref:Uncharacterized protein n=1 Tax=Magnaporthiopsis poae (strain ATCC 64411 / 73-15) TaxID=644358 RepID=A0A0C4DPZ6_MAGP6|nr:hypothetical protein MAPG_01927 [Magnaporthiopsis poae ATCC 64411]